MAIPSSSWLLILSAALVISGCSANTPVLPSADPSRIFFEQVLAEAESQGASESQLETLKTAAARGSVVYADVVSLLPGLQGCIEDVGGYFSVGSDQQIGPELVAPTYSVGIPGLEETAALAVIQSCEQTHIDAVMGALWTQPSTVEARDAEFREALPDVLKCLREHGIVVDDDAPVAEVDALSRDLAGDQGVMCYTQSWG